MGREPRDGGADIEAVYANGLSNPIMFQVWLDWEGD